MMVRVRGLPHDEDDIQFALLQIVTIYLRE